MAEIKENSLAHIILKEWVPALITVVIGGGLLAMLVPRCQVDFERSKAFEARRLAIAESTAKNFTTYILYWQRLRTISGEELSRKLTAEERNRKSGFVERRNEALNLLFADLDLAGLYFGPDVTTLIQEFKKWDRSYADKTLSDLPPMEEWHKWKERILSAMVKEWRRE